MNHVEKHINQLLHGHKPWSRDEPPSISFIPNKYFSRVISILNSVSVIASDAKERKLSRNPNTQPRLVCEFVGSC